MSSRKRKWKGRAHIAPSELFESALFGDDLSESRTVNPRDDRKTLQLCRQVQKALMLALGGECADDVLRDIHVESVQPIGSASQLLVCVALPKCVAVSPLEVLARLNARSPQLRALVARAIYRKRVPTLSFTAVVEHGELPEGGAS